MQMWNEVIKLQIFLIYKNLVNVSKNLENTFTNNLAQDLSYWLETSRSFKQHSKLLSQGLSVAVTSENPLNYFSDYHLPLLFVNYFDQVQQ